MKKPLSASSYSREGYIAVPNSQNIWWGETGTPNGIPLIMLHAGPGGASRFEMTSLLPPGLFRIIQFDQRGCGKSAPTGSWQDNTTQEVINDMEVLRKTLKIKSWLIFGQSWGTALGLAYAIQFPKRCLGFLLSAVYLGDKADVKWFFEGPKNLFPDIYERLLATLPQYEKLDPLGSFYNRVFDSDPKIHGPAAIAFYDYDRWLIPFQPDKGLPPKRGSMEEMLNFCRIFLHYLKNTFFLGDDILLSGISSLPDHPCIIVQGRYDIAVSMRPAWQLHKVWANSELVIVADAAYAPLQPSMAKAICAAATKLAHIIKDKAFY